MSKRDDDGSALLKFSGVPQAGAGGSATSFLGDAALSVSSLNPVDYPISEEMKLFGLTANLLAGITPPGGGSLIIQLLRNGATITGASITYSPGQTGVLTRKIKARYRRGDTLDVQVIANGFSGSAVGQLTVMAAGKLN